MCRAARNPTQRTKFHPAFTKRSQRIELGYPYAWAFFVPFIMVTTFAVVNLHVGLIVSSMQDAHQEEENAATDAYRDEVMAKLGAIEKRLDERG